MLLLAASAVAPAFAMPLEQVVRGVTGNPHTGIPDSDKKQA